MSVFEWIAAIGLIVVAVVIVLLIVCVLSISLIAAALDARDELERGDSGKVGVHEKE